MQNSEKTKKIMLLAFCWSAFFSTHFARMNWSTIFPFAEDPLGLTKTLSGLLMTAPFITYALMQVPAGILTDRVDNKKLMSLTLIIMGIITSLTSLGNSFFEIFLLRLMTGFFASFIYVPSLRLLSLTFKKNGKGQAIGIFITASTIALIILGLVIPPLTLISNWRFGFLVSGIPGIITGISGFFIHSQYLIQKNHRNSSLESSFRKIIVNNGIILSFIASFFAAINLSAIKMWIFDFMVTDLSVTIIFAGIIFSAFNFVTVLNKPIAGWAADIWNKKPIIIGSLLTNAMFCILLPLSPETTLSLIILFSLGLFVGFYVPASTALVTELCDFQALGVVLSAKNMMAMLSFVIQPPLSGYILDTTGTYTWIWIICASSALLSALFTAFIKERRIAED